MVLETYFQTQKLIILLPQQLQILVILLPQTIVILKFQDLLLLLIMLERKFQTLT